MTFDFFDFYDFWMFLLLFVVHNCRNEEINVTKSDFFINIFLFVVQNFVLRGDPALENFFFNIVDKHKLVISF